MAHKMQIIERARGESGEIIDWNESENNIREEVNKRTCKAGYTNSEGGPPATGKIVSMPANDKYRENYVKIFGHD